MKRKRNQKASGGGLKSSAGPEQRAFEAWASSKQIHWHDALALSGKPGTFRIIAKREIGEGEQILRVPTSAVISLKHSPIVGEVNAMKSSGVLDTPMPGVNLPAGWKPGNSYMELAVCIMYELSQGAKSKFAPYLAMLAADEPGVPFTWGTEERACLKGTELERIVDLKVQQLTSEWKLFLVALMEKHPTKFPAAHFTLEKYIAAASLVSSRCYPTNIGIGLVPFADMFNHSEDPDVHYNEWEDDEDEGDDGHEDDAEDAADAADDADAGDNAGDMDAEMTTLKPCKVGKEIFSHYGNHCGVEQLFRYGFLEASAQHPVDYVHFPDELLVEAATEAVTGSTATADVGTQAARLTAVQVRVRLSALREWAVLSETLDGVYEEGRLVVHRGGDEDQEERDGGDADGDEDDSDGGKDEPSLSLLLLVAHVLSLPVSTFEWLQQSMLSTAHCLGADSNDSNGARLEPEQLIRLVVILHERDANTQKKQLPQKDGLIKSIASFIQDCSVQYEDSGEDEEGPPAEDAEGGDGEEADTMMLNPESLIAAVDESISWLASPRAICIAQAAAQLRMAAVSGGEKGGTASVECLRKRERALLRAVLAGLEAVAVAGGE
jgi:hypothetical protein